MCPSKNCFAVCRENTAPVNSAVLDAIHFILFLHPDAADDIEALDILQDRS